MTTAVAMPPLPACASQAPTASAARSRGGHTALHRASESGNAPLVAQLLALGGAASVGVRTKRGFTPLHSASYRNRERVVEILLSAGADVRVPDKNGNTALICACHCGSLAIARLLVAAGADVDAKGTDSRAWTPLNRARALRHSVLEAFLRSCGATRL
jgi:26S proteasome non-ATPase regulatory subunit 10